MRAYDVSAALLLVHFMIVCSLIGTSDSQTATCINQEGKSGICVDVKLCPHLLEILLQNRTADSDQYLRNSLCERPQFLDVYVCCDRPSCATDDGAAGTCIRLEACGAALSSPIKRGGGDAVRTLATRGTCADIRRVCCSRGSVDGYVSRQNGLPEFGFCGVTETPLPDKQENRIASPGQHPWSALLVYRFGDAETERCGGALVSARFVVTAAHCIDSTLVSVRLGVHNITERNKTTPGCCHAVANTSILPSYDAKTRADDIALVILSAPVPYTDRIRPICLPDSRTAYEVQRHPRFYTAGWGVTRHLSGAQLGADALQSWAELPLRRAAVCRGALSVWAQLMLPAVTNATLPRGSLCAGGTFGGELCSQDSGGPLAWSPARPGPGSPARSPARSGPAVLVAVHSATAAGCRAPVPAVYAPVLPHVGWIARTVGDYYATTQRDV